MFQNIDSISFKPYRPLFEEGAGGGKTGDKGGAGAPPEGFISKADFDKTVGELKQQLEDSRLEVLTPEYMAYLEGTKNPPKKESAPASADVDYSKLSPGELVKKLQEDADKRIKEETDKLRNEFNSKGKEAAAKEVAEFARTHDDYEKYRLLMYGLSVEPKNANLGMQALYDLAKNTAKGFGPTEEEIKRSRKSSNEKPGGGSSSSVKDKKYTADEAALEALAELKENGMSFSAE